MVTVSVIAAELLNPAIDATLDLVTEGILPLANFVKDVAAEAGHVGLTPGKFRVESGFAIVEGHSRQGYGTEAVREASASAEEELMVAKNYGVVAGVNVGLVEVLEKAGFQFHSDAALVIGISIFVNLAEEFLDHGFGSLPGTGLELGFAIGLACRGAVSTIVRLADRRHRSILKSWRWCAT